MCPHIAENSHIHDDFNKILFLRIALPRHNLKALPIVLTTSRTNLSHQKHPQTTHTMAMMNNSPANLILLSPSAQVHSKNSFPPSFPSSSAYTRTTSSSLPIVPLHYPKCLRSPLSHLVAIKK